MNLFSIDKSTSPTFQMPTVDPGTKILREIFQEYPVLKNGNDPEKTKVIFANPQRSSIAGNRRLEYFPPDEIGESNLPHPSPGNTAIEVYDPKVQNDPILLKHLIIGDLLHGLRNDEKFNKMRQEFKANFLPQTLDFEKKNGNDMNESRLDEYIRGYLAPDENEEFIKAQNAGHPVYSDNQIKILRKMANYALPKKKQ